jgi:deoxyribonuclease I
VLNNSIVLLLILFSTNLYSEPLQSFSKAKKLLKEVYSTHQYTFYANCKYSYIKGNMIDRESCGYIPRNERTKKGKINKRAKRIEWEHIVPAENFGRQFTCWREGDAKCVKKNGKPYKGRKCCTKVNKKYRIMQADMHNLVPTIGELNADRSNYRFDFKEASIGQYGDVPFQVLFKERRAKIKKDIRGDVARAYLYMADTYGMALSKQERKKFNAWDIEDPLSEWEIKRFEIMYHFLNRNSDTLLK